MRSWMMICALVVVGIAAAAVVTLYLLWQSDWRWRPHTLRKDQDRIAQALEQSGWVSPRLTGPKLYVVVYRACPACIAFETSELPKLQTADVDTRLVVVARAPRNGQALASPAERATVAELWTNRSWKLFQQWSLAAPDAWSAPGLAPADGDAARTAVIATGQKVLAELTHDLADNGVAFDYPMLVWWARDGRMRACACADQRRWKYVEQELAP